MTLIVSIPTKEGVVLASDGQVTAGMIRARGQKVFSLDSHCAWAAAGELALIQRVRESIGASQQNQQLIQVRDLLAGTIKQCVTTLIQLDFRTQFIPANPDALLKLHPGDFVFVECRDQPRILHVLTNGTTEWIERPFATGNADVFAYALLRKYQDVELALEQASVLAVKVIEEAIEVGSYGVGPPICVWQITQAGAVCLDEEKMSLLGDTAQQLRDMEISLLTGQSSAAETETENGSDAGSVEVVADCRKDDGPAHTQANRTLSASSTVALEVKHG